MPLELDLPADQPVTLTDLGAVLGGEAFRAAAKAIEAARTDAAEERVAAYHRLAVEGLTTSPYMFQAALVARERGAFSFNRLERAFLPYASGWRHPDVGADYPTVGRASERVIAPALWPFAQDCPVGDYQVNIAPKWFTHGLLHTLIGFGWWPGLSEWEIMHMARLSEAVAALHWYWLAELGRADERGARIDLTRLDATDAALFLELELDARDRDVRLERLEGEHTVVVGDNAVEILNYESYAYRRGMHDGYLIEPDEKYLEFGEACDYAKVHHRRLASTSFARWRERCLVAGVDYATSAEGFEQRAADVLLALVTPTPASETPAVPRAVRVLQDLGQRLCHAAELHGRPDDGFEAALTVVADGLSALRTDAAADADALVAAALEAVAADVGGVAPGAGSSAPSAADVLALGYAPTDDPHREPTSSKTARAEAAIARAWRVGRVLGTALEGTRPAVRRMVDAPRRASLVDEFRPAAEAAAAAKEIYFVAEGYAGWLEVLQLYWGRVDGVGNVEQNWHYRLARRELPEDPARFGEYVIQLNPYLNRVPLPFDPRWNQEFLDRPRGEVPPFKPRPPHSVNYCLIGPGRRGPVYAPITPKLNGLMIKLKAPRRLDELVATTEVSAADVARAIADEVVLCHHKPFHTQAEVSFNLLEQLMAQAEQVEQRVEAPGPWDDPAQAAAYAEFCERSSLYHDVSVALAEWVGIPSDGRVTELGFGTGVTSQVILERLGPEGRLVAADPAPRMVETIYERVGDDRARFVLGASRALAQIAQFEGAFDRLVANASLWLAADIGDELAHARKVLEAGGRIGFSVPAEYLGDSAHLLTPEALEVSAAFERARATTGVAPPGPGEGAFGADPALGDVAAMRAAVEAAGFSDVRVQRYVRPWPASEYLDWVALPVVIGGMCAAEDKERASELLEAIRAEVSPDTPLATAWLLITATAV